jgi:hypothetical protein
MPNSEQAKIMPQHSPGNMHSLYTHIGRVSTKARITSSTPLSSHHLVIPSKAFNTP